MINVGENNALLPLVSCLSLYKVMGELDAHNSLIDIGLTQRMFSEPASELVQRAFFMTYLQRSALMSALESRRASPVIPVMILAIPDRQKSMVIEKYHDHLFCATYGFGKLGAPDASWGLYALMQFFDSYFRHLPPRTLSSPVVSGMLLRTIEQSVDKATIVSWLEERLPWYRLHNSQGTHVFLLFSFAKIGAISLGDVERKLALLGYGAFSEFGPYTIPGFLADAPQQYRDFASMIFKRYGLVRDLIYGTRSLSDVGSVDISFCLSSETFVFASLIDLILETVNCEKEIERLTNITGISQVRDIADAIIYTCSHPEGEKVIRNFIVCDEGFSRIMMRLDLYSQNNTLTASQIEKAVEALRAVTHVWQEAIPLERILEKDIENINLWLWMLSKQIHTSGFMDLKNHITNRLRAAHPFIESRRKIAETIAQKAMELSNQLHDLDSIEPIADVIANLVRDEIKLLPHACNLRSSHPPRLEA